MLKPTEEEIEEHRRQLVITINFVYKTSPLTLLLIVVKTSINKYNIVIKMNTIIKYNIYLIFF